MSDLAPVVESQKQSSTPLQKALFFHALARRYGQEKADLVMSWIDTPFDDLTTHQQEIVNLVLFWAAFRNALSGPLGMRVATGGKLVRFSNTPSPKAISSAGLIDHC